MLWLLLIQFACTEREGLTCSIVASNQGSSTCLLMLSIGSFEMSCVSLSLVEAFHYHGDGTTIEAVRVWSLSEIKMNVWRSRHWNTSKLSLYQSSLFIVCHFLHVIIQHQEATPLLTCDIILHWVTSSQHCDFTDSNNQQWQQWQQSSFILQK